jgi:hypothetical protein
MVGDPGARSDGRGWSKVMRTARQVLRAAPLAAFAATEVAFAATTVEATPRLA